VRDGDVFVVTKLDRLARSVGDLASIVQKLETKKVDLVVLDQGIDTTTMYGLLQFNILADLLNDFEAPGCSKTEIAEHYGISRSSVYRLYAKNRQQCV
jgi:DNA invertase Pin-like site-specific DNA recombinase